MLGVGIECLLERQISPCPAELGGNNLNGVEDFRDGKGSSQGHNLALTGFFVSNLLDPRKSLEQSSNLLDVFCIYRSVKQTAKLV